MAKQKGDLKITGTYNGLCYYKMDGQYYVRRKSSLSRKRVKRSPAFRRTMEYAGLLAQASRIAVAVYNTFPRSARKHAVYRAMTGKAMYMLKEGLEAAEVQSRLQEVHAPVIPPVEQPPVKVAVKALRITQRQQKAAKQQFSVHTRDVRIKSYCITGAGLLRNMVPPDLSPGQLAAKRRLCQEPAVVNSLE